MRNGKYRGTVYENGVDGQRDVPPQNGCTGGNAYDEAHARLSNDSTDSMLSDVNRGAVDLPIRAAVVVARKRPKSKRSSGIG